MKKAALAAAIFLAISATGGILAYRSVAAGSKDGEQVAFVVQPGWPADRIARELQEQGIVTSAFAFRVFLRVTRGERDLRAGEYELRLDMPYSELARELRKGPELKFVRLTIPEGLTMEQTAARVEEHTHISTGDFLAAATTALVRPSIAPDGVKSLEGFLYPKTYYVIERETAPDLVLRLVRQFEQETGGLDWGAAASLDRTPFEILVIASMIEEEAKVDEERPLISAVIHNRLRLGMKLEIDATVQYAVRKYQGQPLTQSDLDIDSPYNTRKFPGIPPGPIASPRAGSIAAALQPAASDALFFVLTPDCKRHLFTADYNEFLRAKTAQVSC